LETGQVIQLGKLKKEKENWLQDMPRWLC
jgi:hypothetical protein